MFRLVVDVFSCFTGPHRPRGENHKRHREKIFQMSSSLVRMLTSADKKSPTHTRIRTDQYLLEKNRLKQGLCLHLVDSPNTHMS